MSAPPDAIGDLLERFDRDAFDMPRGRARVRLTEQVIAGNFCCTFSAGALPANSGHERS